MKVDRVFVIKTVVLRVRDRAVDLADDGPVVWCESPVGGEATGVARVSVPLLRTGVTAARGAGAARAGALLTSAPGARADIADRVVAPVRFARHRCRVATSSR